MEGIKIFESNITFVIDTTIEESESKILHMRFKYNGVSLWLKLECKPNERKADFNNNNFFWIRSNAEVI